MPITHAKGLLPQEADPLFIGLFPGGVSYANRNVEEHGDYKRLAFLPYDTWHSKSRRTVLPSCETGSLKTQRPRPAVSNLHVWSDSATW
jgi:hypothetical protein